MKNLLGMIALLAVLLASSRHAKADVDCNSAAGVLALMAAKVVVGTPGDPGNSPPAAGLPFRVDSELFKVPQAAATNSACEGKVSFRLYTSTNSNALDGLPSLAAANANFAAPNSVIASDMGRARSGNVLTANAGRNRADYPFVRVPAKGTPTTVRFPPRVGNTVWYRIAKRIRNCSTCSGQDPYVFSPVFSFVVPEAPPVVAPEPKPDLVPTPASTSSVNRPLFAPSSGSNSAGGVTFLKIPDAFCQGLGDPANGCQSAAGCSHSVNLGPIVFGAKNTGTAEAGAFSVTLQRRDRAGSNPISVATQVAAQQVTSLAAGAQSANFSFEPNKTVTVFTLKDNPGSCFVRCDPNQAGCVVDYQEVEYTVRVDGGDNVAGSGQVQESNESNNEARPAR